VINSLTKLLSTRIVLITTKVCNRNWIILIIERRRIRALEKRSKKNVSESSWSSSKLVLSWSRLRLMFDCLYLVNRRRMKTVKEGDGCCKNILMMMITRMMNS
jgi:hypothetical protein